MPDLRRVALLIEPSAGYTRGLLRGILQFVRENPHWRAIHGPYNRGGLNPQALKGWQGQGIIARIDNPAIAKLVQQAGVPAVDVSSHGLLPNVPAVTYDDAKIGRLAAQHFLQRGLHHFAFCGHMGFAFVRRRYQSFKAELATHDLSCEVFPTDRRQPGRWQLPLKNLMRWLLKLPHRPLGLLAAWDGYGEQVLDACREANLKVPQEIAVLGVDDDELLCALSDPPLSSIKLNSEGTGRFAAELLEKLMQGLSVPRGPHRLEPLTVTERLSTDVQAVSDPLVAHAIGYIRHHACLPIHVSDVVAAVGVSRRLLEDRFQHALHRTPFNEIERVKVQHIQQLLCDTDLPLAIVAERCGFDHVETLIGLFKRNTGITPGQYRVKFRQPQIRSSSLKGNR